MCQVERPALFTLFLFWRCSKIVWKHIIIYIYKYFYTHTHNAHTLTRTYIVIVLVPMRKNTVNLCMVRVLCLPCDLLWTATMCCASFLLWKAKTSKSDVSLPHGKMKLVGTIFLYVEFCFMMTWMGWIYFLCWTLNCFYFLEKHITQTTYVIWCLDLRVKSQARFQ